MWYTGKSASDELFVSDLDELHRHPERKTILVTRGNRDTAITPLLPSCIIRQVMVTHHCMVEGGSDDEIEVDTPTVRKPFGELKKETKLRNKENTTIRAANKKLAILRKAKQDRNGYCKLTGKHEHISLNEYEI